MKLWTLVNLLMKIINSICDLIWWRKKTYIYWVNTRIFHTPAVLYQIIYRSTISDLTLVIRASLVSSCSPPPPRWIDRNSADRLRGSLRLISQIGFNCCSGAMNDTPDLPLSPSVQVNPLCAGAGGGHDALTIAPLYRNYETKTVRFENKI